MTVTRGSTVAFGGLVALPLLVLGGLLIGAAVVRLVGGGRRVIVEGTVGVCFLTAAARIDGEGLESSSTVTVAVGVVDEGGSIGSAVRGT
ncbi:MAG: hypothetical protein FD118_4241 [Rhodocyclaceae bacterium]|nr:MAG: hypothetical protein FD118_4241 [Rhodocyclaceae bacterium]